MVRFIPAAALAAALFVSSSGIAAAQPATVFVVHGIPGANGFPSRYQRSLAAGVNACVPNATFTQILGPVALPRWRLLVAVNGGGSGCTGVLLSVRSTCSCCSAAKPPRSPRHAHGDG